MFAISPVKKVDPPLELGCRADSLALFIGHVSVGSSHDIHKQPKWPHGLWSKTPLAKRKKRDFAVRQFATTINIT
jgi:hypothetical protein